MNGPPSVKANAIALIGLQAAAFALVSACTGGHPSTDASRALDSRTLWRLIEDLSETGGTFVSIGSYRSDNVVSNERGLQTLLPVLAPSLRGTVYIGVGPEQNFTFITAIEPSMAFIVDVRRENLLLHLMYKGLAEVSPDRSGFLSRLFAREPPADLQHDAGPEELFDAFRRVPQSPSTASRTLAAIVRRLRADHRFPITDRDIEVIGSIYGRFAREGPDVRWDPDGGSWIPTYAELMTETDGRGAPRSYLASEAAFQVFRRYQTDNRVIPLVGDFGGTKTLKGIGDYVRKRGLVVGVFYISNVEPYLRGDGGRQFAMNVAMLPRDESSVLVRTRLGQTGETRGRRTSRRDRKRKPWITMPAWSRP
jgi:hypothetical protein